MKKIMYLIHLFFTSFSFAGMPEPLLKSHQLLLVLTAHSENSKGQMQRFERNSLKDSWQPIGRSIPVVLGKKGLGKDTYFKIPSRLIPIKREGDYRTPIGAYYLGSEFGFANHPNKKSYMPLKKTTVCVDDIQSRYYNQIIDSAKVSYKDWYSSELMRTISQYKYGAVIQYNMDPIKPSLGSCIFLHIWKNSHSGTAGCIAMSEDNLKETLQWLDWNHSPVIVILTQSLYKKLQYTWQLP